MISTLLTANGSDVCAIGNTNLFDNIDTVAELKLFLKAWDNSTYEEIFGADKDPSFEPKSVNIGGNQMYHSFGLWIVLKTLVKHGLVDYYIESGVFNGFTAKFVRRLLGPNFPIVLIDPMEDPKNDGTIWIPYK